jgi:hypothetical protein
MRKQFNATSQDLSLERPRRPQEGAGPELMPFAAY